jgi:hypothetical protein
VVSEANAVLSAPPPNAEPVLVTFGTAVLPTVTIKEMGGSVSVGETVAVVVAVIVCPVTVNVQPIPVKLPETKVRLLGNTSVTVTVPLVEALPLLPTVSV